MFSIDQEPAPGPLGGIRAEPSASGPSPSAARVETTELLNRWSSGDGDAAEEALCRCYDELRALARACLRGERPDHTLEATELVHEVLAQQLRDGTRALDREHFVGRAGRAMRALLVDHARARRAAKRGGEKAKVPLDEVRHRAAREGVGGRPGSDRVDVLDLERVLAELEALDPDKARLVEMRFYLGLGLDDAASALGISRASVVRQWRLVRAWLQRRLGTGAGRPR